MSCYITYCQKRGVDTIYLVSLHYTSGSWIWYFFPFQCSPFIMECLKEFYMTYDDTRLRWNGADLLTRVAKKFLRHGNLLTRQPELNVQGSLIFFPIHSQNITRYISKFFNILCVLLHKRGFIWYPDIFQHEHGSIFERWRQIKQKSSCRIP